MLQIRSKEVIAACDNSSSQRSSVDVICLTCEVTDVTILYLLLFQDTVGDSEIAWLCAP